MIVSSYRYEKPAELKKLLELSATEGARLLAGGTDIIPLLRDDRIDPELIVDIKGVQELRGIYPVEGGLFIGAAEPIQDVAENSLAQEYHAVVEGASHLGCYEIRNRATIGGNICNGSPSADSVPGLLLYNAKVTLLSLEGERSIPLEEFLLGPGRVDLKPGEVLKGVRLEAPGLSGRSKYYRRSRVKGMDLSGLSAAVYCEGYRNFRIALGAAWPTVARAHEAERILNSGTYSEALADEAAAAIVNDISPRRSSMRASPEYKKEMIPVLIKMAIEELNRGEPHE
jgi:CO/xanthine dehydrogenase FAD-binding subunit